MKKRIYICALALSMTLSLTACGEASSTDDNKQTAESSDNAAASDKADDSETVEPKEISVEDLTITLTSDFGKSVTEDYDFYYSSSSAICIGIRESKEELSANEVTFDSIDDYAAKVMEKSGITAVTSPINDNAVYFEWNKTIKEKDYCYIGYVTTSSDACWLIQFGCLLDKYEELKPQFLEYLNSVKVN